MNDEIIDTNSNDSGEEKGLAVLAHLLAFFTGFLGALIIFLLADNKPFVKENAKEALNFQITVLIGLAASMLLMIVLIGFLTFFAILICDIIFCILAAIKANNGETYRYPLSIRLIK